MARTYHPRDAQIHSHRRYALKANYADACYILRQLTNLGHAAYMAGGCVRDMQLGLTPNDYDITTSATPDQVQEAFVKTVPVGASFGVVKVVIDGRELDVATFRTDGKYSDNRRPDSVSFSKSAEEDVQRRDFTINGLLRDIDGKIIDYVGGIADLKSNTLRTIGNAGDRFEEDALRMLRAIRFAVRFRMDINEQAWLTIQAMRDTIKNISKERVTDELSKMFCYGQAERAYFLLRKSGLWQSWFGHIPDADDSWRVMFALSHLKPGDPFILTLAILSCEMYTTEMEGFQQNLVLTNVQKAGFISIIERAKEMTRFLHKDQAEQRKMLQWEDLDLVERFIDYQVDGSNKFDYDYPYGMSEGTLVCQKAKIRAMGWPSPLVTGKDLIEMGFIPGAAFSDMLELVRDQQLKGMLDEKKFVKPFLINRFPATPRTLENGTLHDDTGFRRVIQQCPKCFRSMSAELPKDATGKLLWSQARSRMNMRDYDTIVFAESSCCGGKRKKSSFTEAQL